MNDKAADKTVRAAALSCPPAFCRGASRDGETDATSLKSRRKPASSSGPSAYAATYDGLGRKMQAAILQCSIASALVRMIANDNRVNAQKTANLAAGRS